MSVGLGAYLALKLACLAPRRLALQPPLALLHLCLSQCLLSGAVGTQTRSQSGQMQFSLV